MPELRLTPWRVYEEKAESILFVAPDGKRSRPSKHVVKSRGSRTSLGRRTLHRPALLSCDMTAKASSMCASLLPSSSRVFRGNINSKKSIGLGETLLDRCRRYGNSRDGDYFGYAMRSS